MLMLLLFMSDSYSHHPEACGCHLRQVSSAVSLPPPEDSPGLQLFPPASSVILFHWLCMLSKIREISPLLETLLFSLLF